MLFWKERTEISVLRKGSLYPSSEELGFTPSGIKRTVYSRKNFIHSPHPVNWYAFLQTKSNDFIPDAVKPSPLGLGYKALFNLQEEIVARYTVGSQ